MNRTTSALASLIMTIPVLQHTPVAMADSGLVFTRDASFVATQHSDLRAPLGGMGYDPYMEKVELLAGFDPSSRGPFLTIFEFDGAQASFGLFVRDFSDTVLTDAALGLGMTYDSVHGVAYFFQDEEDHIVVNPRHVNPRNAPSNDFVDFGVSETGPAGITYDERDDTLVILLRSDGTNSGQQLIRIPYNSGTIVETTDVDSALDLDGNSKIVLDPTTGNYFISVGAQIFEITPGGRKTGHFFSTPGGLTVMGMEFGTGNSFFILEADGTVSRGTLTRDSDGDGVANDADACPNSDLSLNVTVDGCNSEVPNTLFPSGCTISDRLTSCATNAASHGRFVSCVAEVTTDLEMGGIIVGQQKGAIQNCAAKSYFR